MLVYVVGTIIVVGCAAAAGSITLARWSRKVVDEAFTKMGEDYE